MKLDVAHRILKNLNTFEIEILDKAHWRYMHFIDIIKNPETEDIKLAKEDRENYTHLLTLSICDVEKAIQFMMSITGMPRDYCEAWGEFDFDEKML